MSWWKWNGCCRAHSLVPGFAHETDFLYWQMEALMTKYSLRRSRGWEWLGRVSACYKSVYLFSPDDLLSWFEWKPIFSFILKGIPLKLHHKLSLYIQQFKKSRDFSSHFRPCFHAFRKERKYIKLFMHRLWEICCLETCANIYSTRFPE